MISLTQTERLVREKFAGKMDRTEVPMADHMMRVAARVADEDEMTQHIAWLHDIVEDTNVTITELIALEYPTEVIDAVVLLTHDKKVMDYQAYIDRLCTSGNLRAIKVKLADQADNLDPQRQLRLNKYVRNALRKKYSGVQVKLMEAALCLNSTANC